MYTSRSQRLAFLLVCGGIVTLAAHSLWEFAERFVRPNPFNHNQVGVPQLAEGPFDPTRNGIDPTLLPWIIDASANWPTEERQAARSPETLRRMVAARYPLWKQHIKVAGHAPDGALVLEAHPAWELVVSKDGLMVRAPEQLP